MLLYRLNSCIELYAREDSLLDNLTPIKPKTLKNPDMFHFGWNMAHYFGYDKQDIVPSPKQVFLQLRDLEDSTIKGKLYDSSKHI